MKTTNLIPEQYLSKRENNSYCLIFQGMPINSFCSKQQCNALADRLKIKLTNQVWDSKQGNFITEDK